MGGRRWWPGPDGEALAKGRGAGPPMPVRGCVAALRRLASAVVQLRSAPPAARRVSGGRFDTPAYDCAEVEGAAAVGLMHRPQPLAGNLPGYIGTRVRSAWDRGRCRVGRGGFANGYWIKHDLSKEGCHANRSRRIEDLACNDGGPQLPGAGRCVRRGFVQWWEEFDA